MLTAFKYQNLVISKNGKSHKKFVTIEGKIFHICVVKLELKIFEQLNFNNRVNNHTVRGWKFWTFLSRVFLKNAQNRESFKQ